MISLLLAWITTASAQGTIDTTADADPTIRYYYMQCGIPVPPAVRDVSPEDDRYDRVADGWERDVSALEALMAELPSYGQSVDDAAIHRVERMIDHLACAAAPCPKTFAEAFRDGPFQPDADLLATCNGRSEPVGPPPPVPVWTPATPWRRPLQVTGFTLAAGGVFGAVATAVEQQRLAAELNISRGMRTFDAYDPRQQPWETLRDTRTAAVTAGATGLVIAVIASLIPRPHERRGPPDNTWQATWAPEPDPLESP
jgi:hypothetical protein